MKVYIANKVLSGFSLVLALALFGTCIWTLTSLLLRDSSGKDCAEYRLFHKYDIPEGLSLCNETLPESPTAYPPLEDEHVQSPGHPSHPNYTEAVIIDSGSTAKSYEKYLAEFDEMEPFFRTLVICCLGIVIVCSFIQIVCSSLLIFSPYHKVVTRSRRIVIILFVIFLLYLLGFAWPLAYRRVKELEDDDNLHTMSTLSSSIMQFCDDFQWSKLVRDLNLYYVLLFCDSLFLFLYMVMTCCLLRCVTYEVYDS